MSGKLYYLVAGEVLVHPVGFLSIVILSTAHLLLNSEQRSEPAFGEVSSLLGLDDDVEWKEMTEEEESLALEEHSLNLEIEHVEEVREKRQKVIERKRLLLESRMERAQENREKNITEIIRRAKDDEQKVLEVQFINSLQGGNMLLDLRMRDAGVEERKQTLAEERARRMEEKAAKEHAAEERRKLAELERIARLQEIAEKKEARHAQIAAQRNEQERLRNERRKQQQEKLNELRIADAEENESRRKRIQEKMSTELEAVAHVMSQAHLSKVNIDLLQVSTDDLVRFLSLSWVLLTRKSLCRLQEREFCALSQTPTSECGDENGEDDSAWRKKRAKVKQRLAARNKKIAELTETPPSPGRQARCLRDLTNVIAKCQQKSNRLDDSTLQMLDRSLSDCYREAQSQEWFAANISQYFNNSSVLPDLLGFLIKWTTTGANASVVVATAFCDLLLKAAVSAVRSQPSSVDATKIESCNPEHFVEAAIRMCARLSKDPTCWKMLLESPEMSVRILLLLGHIIRSIDKETGSSTPGVTPSLQLTALELTSQYTSFSLSHQVSCVLGGQRSLLAVVASLPVFYLTRPSLRILFVPALISMTHGNRLAMQLLLEEMSEKHVTKFIAEAQAGQVRNINALDKIVPGRDFDSLLRFYQVTDE
ncbi:hypothetical protein ANCCEY_09100 [Ancylostoma ceylanicum]|uniref:Uncharacterized protein n=1 Tax=Ancylostoma ceylanicum TaxID=53326 RepID=A0A0D6LIE7_9BILA|nr:hypothetical protein ANCCEY_09100 [Ancylostoma ceylanicum]